MTPAPTPHLLHLHSGNLMELLEVKLIELWPSYELLILKLLYTELLVSHQL